MSDVSETHSLGEMSAAHKMLSAVAWRPTEPPVDPGPLPWTTHQGVLQMGDGQEIRCYRLNDGRAVLHSEDVKRFFAESQLP